MAKKTFFDTLKGNFVKHFLSTVLSLYAYELMQGIDPFHFDMALARKLFAGGMVAFLPTVANYLNPNDPRFGTKPKAQNFPKEAKNLRE